MRRVEGLGFKVRGFRVSGLRFGVHGLGIESVESKIVRVSFRFLGAGFEV